MMKHSRMYNFIIVNLDLISLVVTGGSNKAYWGCI